MFRLFKRPFTTKICLECINYKDGMCLKSIKEKSFITGEIKHKSAHDARHSICGVEEPKFFESNLSNMENDLIIKTQKHEKLSRYFFFNLLGISLNCGFILSDFYSSKYVFPALMASSFQVLIQMYFLMKTDEEKILLDKIKNDVELIKKI